MKELAVEEIATNADAAVERLKSGGTLLTHHGAPMALVLSLDLYDQEDVQLMTSASFWDEITERRKEPTVPWSKVKQELLDADGTKE